MFHKTVYLIFSVFTAFGLMQVQGLSLDLEDASDSSSDSLFADFADEIGVDLEDGFSFILVDHKNPSVTIEDSLYWRSIPTAIAAKTFPTEFRIAGNIAIGPEEKLLEGDRGVIQVWEPRGSAEVPRGTFSLKPGDISFGSKNGSLTSSHPAVIIKGSEVRIRCAPVVFQGLTDDGVPVPVPVQIYEGKNTMLRENGPFSLLTVWLPVAVDYRSSFGEFRVEQDGSLRLLSPKPNVEIREGTLVQRMDPVTPEPPRLTPPTDQLYLWTHRGRSVFTQEEKIHLFVILPRGFPGGLAQLKVNGTFLADMDLPAAGDRNWDSKGWLLDASAFPPGPLVVEVDAGDTGQSTPLNLEIVRWQRKNPFLIQSMSCCTEQWPTSEEGLKLLSDSGLEMLASTGHRSALNTQVPTIPEDYDPALPPERSMVRPFNDQLLESFLRYRLLSVDLTVARGLNFYNEGLSYHHSYPTSVDRMIRRMSIFTQQTAAYPSFWGVNYSWFPKPGGYAEGGVPTDYHVGKRNQAMDENLVAQGFENINWHERRKDLQWAGPNSWSENPEERDKARSTLRQNYERWRVYNRLGFGEHNALYNRAVHAVRPETRTLLFDNAGHDSQNRARDQFNDMTAVAYESYTDYGEWPMSPAFSTDWAKGTSPGQPVWLTVDWGTSSEGKVKSLYHAFARGLDGGGVPMQGNVPLTELRRRGKMLQTIQLYGSIAPHVQPDARIGILVTPSMRYILRQYYDYHAVYYYLTRLGVPPILIDGEDVMAHGVPKDLSALLIVDQVVPFFPEVRAAIEDYAAQGGTLMTVGECKPDLPGAVSVPGDVKNIWDLNGFFPESHQALWNQFTEIWRQPLQEALEKIGVQPLAVTDPLRGLAVAFDVGPVRYVVVTSDAEGTHTRDVEVQRGLPVRLQGTPAMVRDLARQQDLELRVEDGFTVVDVDLISEPATLLAMFNAAPGQLQLSTTDEQYSTAVSDTQGVDMGAVPLRYTLQAPDGTVYDTLYRTAGDWLELPVPPHAMSGTWKLTVQELLTGKTVHLMIAHTQSTPESILEPIADVQIVNPHQMKVYAQAQGERVILLDTNQRHLRPLADKLAAQLQAAGISVRIWQLTPEEMDSIPNRWIPREEDIARKAQVDAGTLIGYRQNLSPYIDKDLEKHIPDRGGYGTVDPPWMIGQHAILFSGSRFAESLQAVETWMPTPSIPGTGQGRLVVSLNTFMANRHAVVVAAHDQAGLTAATETLAKEMLRYAGAEKLEPTPEEKPAKLAARQIEPEVTKEPVPTPLVGFRPFLQVRRVFDVGDGRGIVWLRGEGNNIVVLGKDGAVESTFQVPARDVTVDSKGAVWAYTGKWRKGVQAVGVSSAGEVLDVIETHPGNTVGDFPRDGAYENNLRVGPNGKWIAAARFGGLYIGNRETREWRFYDDLPYVKWRFELWNPRLPIALTYSPDGSKLFFTMDSRPTGSNNMSGYSFSPAGNEMVMLNIEDLKRIWVLREPVKEGVRLQGGRYSGAALDSKKYVAHSGYVALSEQGEQTALADYIGYFHTLNASGDPTLSLGIAPVLLHERIKTGIGPLEGVGTWISPSGELSAYARNNQIIIAKKGTPPVTIDLPGIHSARVTADDKQVVVSLINGEVIAFDPSGQKVWTFDSLGSRAELAVASDGGMWVANHFGMLFFLNPQGEVQWQLDVLKASKEAPLHAVTVTEESPRFPRQPLYREPNTLQVAKTHLSAREETKWTPSSAEGTEKFGKTFYPVSADIRLSVQADRPCFARLVYRRPVENQTLSLETLQPSGKIKYEMDLDTPEYRVVYVPMFGKDKTVTLKTEGPVEIAEFSIWSFEWPGPNVALIKADSLGSGMELMDGGAESLGRLDGLDDIMDLDQDGSTLSGEFKEVNVYFWNEEPGQIRGFYLNPKVQPMVVVDGERFVETPLQNYWSLNDRIGSWFTVQFPYAVPVHLVATYSVETKQSEVSGHLAVFKNFDPKGWRDEGQVLGGQIETDQFWNLVPINEDSVEYLGVHIYQFTRNHGLAEVEVYIDQKK